MTISDDSIDAFVIDHQIKIQLERHKATNIRYSNSLLETREIYTIPLNELNQILCQCLLSVRKDDGNQYEQVSLKGML